MYSIQKVSHTLTLLVAPFILVACGGGGGSSDSKKEENLNLTNDTAFVYVARNVSSVEESISAARLTKTSQSTSLLELGSPYDFNPGAKLVSRSSLDAEAIDTDLLTQYFGSADFDVKDISVSADGKKAVFAAHGPSNHPRDYTWNIYEYNFSERTVRRVITSDFIANAGEDTNPTYALDGTIVFSSNRAAGNPNSPVDNIVDPEQAANCRKLDAGDNVSLLHSMSPNGDNILQLTYGKNHDIKPTTLKDGRIAFVRWTHTNDLVEGCPVNTEIQADALKVEYPVGLDSPQKWSQDKLCALATETENGFVLPTNHYTLLTITADGKDMDQLYKTVTVSGSDEGFIEVDQIVQAENGHLVALLKHHYNSMAGGDIVELQSPDQIVDQQVFGNIAPESLVGDIALYPEQHSVEGWYSAFWPYRDGSGRLLVSWSQCATTKNGVNQLCQSSTSEGEVEGRYGIWVFDQKTDSRLPIVLAKKDVVYSNLAVAQPHVGVDFPFAPHNANYVDNLDSNKVVCTYTSSSSYSSYSYSSSYSSYSSYSSESSYSSSSSSSYIYVPVSSYSSSSASSYNSYSSEASSSYDSSSSSYNSSSSLYSSSLSSSSLSSSSSSSYNSSNSSSLSSSYSSSNSSSSYSSSSSSSSSSLSSSSAYSSSSSVNARPVANAGLDQVGSIGARATLDGSGSTDADGDQLTYQWTVLDADGSVLTDATSVMAGLTPTQRVSYTVQLVVSDGKLTSAPDTALVTVNNTAPVANAGPDQSGNLGNPMHLDGSASTDADGDQLTYAWRLVQAPAGSTATLADADKVRPVITPDQFGLYTLELVVNDGYISSTADTVTIDTRNAKPIANAGADQAVVVDDLVVLNGGGSSDADGDTLTYSWSLLSKPSGSSATLVNSQQVLSQIEIDKAGSYVLQLIVNDGKENSEPDTVVVTTKNVRPVAEAGNVQTVVLGETVKLDGSGSYDPDGDAITYSWSFMSKPSGSTAVLQDTLAQRPTFTADKVGSFVVQLIVSDGSLSASDTVTINVEQPVCSIDSSTKRSVPVTIRDFDKSHPDFEKALGEDLGIVKDTLGSDGLPVYAHGNNKTLTTTGQANFNQWFRDVQGVNIKFPRSIEMTRAQGSTVWSYVNSSFFPIDGLGFGNMKSPSPNHNYHFTLETHLAFDYVGGEVFTFRGDDDLWVYINGKLAIDIGGIHDVIERSVNLDKVASKLGIEKGKRYTFDLFFAERHTVKSNFMFQTNINLECLPQTN
jgi:fibro-slime domain-containing protein